MTPEISPRAQPVETSSPPTVLRVWRKVTNRTRSMTYYWNTEEKHATLEVPSPGRKIGTTILPDPAVYRTWSTLVAVRSVARNGWAGCPNTRNEAEKSASMRIVDDKRKQRQLQKSMEETSTFQLQEDPLPIYEDFKGSNTVSPRCWKARHGVAAVEWLLQKTFIKDVKEESRDPESSQISVLNSKESTTSMVKSIQSPGKHRHLVMEELRDSEWMNTAKHKNHKITLEGLESDDLITLLAIFNIATEMKSREKSHSLFKKGVIKYIGKAGANNDNWKNSGEIGISAHRIYHQLFKIQKQK